ncbi:sarcospan [Scleropages formosus]|uniref:Sarcospan (Kras oncogene-associated gene) n=2 Tax=Scleropages formosus TaxID=113540 RepID=A0A8C9RIJ9_SCLFO|nr:sarcospan [Scleropages formosus]
MGTEEKSPAGGKQKKTKDASTPAVPDGAPTCCGCRFPLLVALLQLLLGVSIAAVAFIMATISPSLQARETPHWAGIIVCLVAVLGFILCCVTYLPDEKTSKQFIAKLLYFLMCTLGLVLSVLAIAFACHHYAQISAFSCQERGEDCFCTLEPEDPIARTFLYTGVSDCATVTSTLRLYFLLQVALNLAQALVCLTGAFIMWKHRYQVFFVGMQSASSPGQQWQKI